MAPLRSRWETNMALDTARCQRAKSIPNGGHQSKYITLYSSSENENTLQWWEAIKISIHSRGPQMAGLGPGSATCQQGYAQVSSKPVSLPVTQWCSQCFQEIERDLKWRADRGTLGSICCVVNVSAMQWAPAAASVPQFPHLLLSNH